MKLCRRDDRPSSDLRFRLLLFFLFLLGIVSDLTHHEAFLDGVTGVSIQLPILSSSHFVDRVIDLLGRDPQLGEFVRHLVLELVPALVQHLSGCKKDCV